MIKIRYADLPQGRHTHVHSAGRRPVIYLVPGLSPAQRRDALRRLIRTSRQGYGPRLWAPGVRFAVARDVTKTTAGNGLAAVRCHPAGSTALAAVIAAGVICYAFFVTVTVRFTPHPAGPPVAAPSGPRVPGGRSPGSGATGPAGTQPSVTGRRTAAATGTGATAGPGTGSGPSGRPTSSGPLPTGTWSAPGGVLPSGSAGPSSPASSPPSATPAPVPSAAPSASPAPPGNPGGLCLQLGPLGVCVSG
ncbi:MAG TPA: hypothetical protein VHT94_07125 [Streptosporangiaceae bacterium]|nr:hypothetical protein [Streptosporangiaceae bacterium]